jgi:hypothetical protein
MQLLLLGWLLHQALVDVMAYSQIIIQALHLREVVQQQ